MVLVACSHSLKLEFLPEVYTLLMVPLCYSFDSKALNVAPLGYPCCAVTLQQNVAMYRDVMHSYLRDSAKCSHSDTTNIKLTFYLI